MKFGQQRHCKARGHIPCDDLGWTSTKFLCRSILWFDASCMVPQHEDHNGKDKS